MGYSRGNAHGCSCPGCHNPVTHDLVLSTRVKLERESPRTHTKYQVKSQAIVHHLYLCDKHWPEMYDFMEGYEGKE